MSNPKKTAVTSASRWTNQAVHALNQALDRLDPANERTTLHDHAEDCRDRLITLAAAVRNRAQETRDNK